MLGRVRAMELLPSTLFMTVALGAATLEDHVKLATFCGPSPSYPTSIQSLWSEWKKVLAVRRFISSRQNTGIWDLSTL